MIIKATKKPVTIEAVQYTFDNLDECKAFIGYDAFCGWNDDLFIKTLEGEMKVSVNDYIIKGIKGEFYPCKPDIFEKTYDIHL